MQVCSCMISVTLPIVMRACFMWNFNLAPKLVLNSKQSLRSAAAGTKRLEPWGTPESRGGMKRRPWKR
ncbi:hypothetical protein Hanom_Chr16g01420031 [Helianthus anomalus]